MTDEDTRSRSTPPPGDADVRDPDPAGAVDAGDAGVASASSEATDAAKVAEAAGHASAADASGTDAVRVDDVGAVPEPAPRDPRLDELDALKKERSELGERLLRTAADFDNFRKRSRREIDEAKLRGKDDALRELLPVFDNLERAVRAAGEANDSGAVLEGVRMVLKLFEDTAQRMGLNRVPTIGERFDPAVHEAIQQAESADHAPGTIIAEITPGYLFGKRLLRAAMVIVARRPTETKPTPAKDADPTAAEADAKPAGEGTEPAAESRDATQGESDAAGAEGSAP